MSLSEKDSMVDSYSGGGARSAGHEDSSGDESSLQRVRSMTEALISKFESMQKDIEEVRVKSQFHAPSCR